MGILGLTGVRGPGVEDSLNFLDASRKLTRVMFMRGWFLRLGGMCWVCNHGS